MAGFRLSFRNFQHVLLFTVDSLYTKSLTITSIMPQKTTDGASEILWVLTIASSYGFKLEVVHSWLIITIQEMTIWLKGIIMLHSGYMPGCQWGDRLLAMSGVSFLAGTVIFSSAPHPTSSGAHSTSNQMDIFIIFTVPHIWTYTVTDFIIITMLHCNAIWNTLLKEI
jgi:hypothetical protein